MSRKRPSKPPAERGPAYEDGRFRDPRIQQMQAPGFSHENFFRVIGKSATRDRREPDQAKPSVG